MPGRIAARVCCALLLLMAAWLFAESVTGRALIFDEGPDATTGPVALFCALLGLLLLACGEVAALRERVEALERDRRA